MKISILTLFPQMFLGPLDYSIIKRAKEEKLVEINLIDIRNFGIGKHKAVDDTPYGGGIGMVLRVDVLKRALESATNRSLNKNEQKVILLSAGGKKYDQKMARDFGKLKHLVIICGHYEGVDERVLQFVDEEASVGDFVMTGGEIPAMAITDSVVRLLKGVLKKGATESESFSENMHLEYPQYTKPRTFENLETPEVLLSGNHKEINAWREDKSLKKTKLLRKGLIKN